MDSGRNIISEKMIDLLKQFSIDEKTKTVRDVAKTFLSSVLTFNELEENQQAKDIVALRKMLLSYYNNPNMPSVYIEGTDFRKLLCNLLVTLAEQFPVNDIDPDTALPLDPITWLPIDEADRFVTLTGQLFSIDYIIKYNKDRMCREDSLGENVHEKYLLNPFTNQPFSPIDTERLIIIAGKRGKDLDFLIDKPSDAKNGPSGFSLFSLKNIASLTNRKNERPINNVELKLTANPKDMLVFMTIAAKNNEYKTHDYLYTYLPQPYKDLLKQPDKVKLLGSTIQLSSVNEFIFLAAKNNEPKMLKKFIDYLIVAGLDVNCQYKGVSAIHIAAEHGSVEAISILLDPQYKIKIDQQNYVGYTAANIAAQYKKIDVIRTLAKAGANLMIPGLEGMAPAHAAAMHDDVEVMNLLLEYKVNIEQDAEAINYQRTVAHVAALYNSKKVTKMLLDYGADFNKADENGFTPLHLAADYSATEVMQILLQHKDKVSRDQVTKGPIPHTVTTIAAVKGHVPILKLLAEAKVDLTQPRIDNGATPLHLAVLNGHYQAATFLIDYYKKNIFVKQNDGRSPFLLACLLRNWEIAKLFLNKIPDEEIPKEDKARMKHFHQELGLDKSILSRLLIAFGFYALPNVVPKEFHKRKRPSSPSP